MPPPLSSPHLLLVAALLTLALRLPDAVIATPLPSASNYSNAVVPSNAHLLSSTTGVWTVTKVASLFGPTVAIFLYQTARDAFERYEPFVTASVLEFIQSVCAAVHPPFSRRRSLWLSSMPSPLQNPHVTRVANEIIRLTNIRLRERAVISRIQMEDDHYEFTRALTDTDVRIVALQVMEAVLSHGSGSYLSVPDKAAVHALIASSVY